MATSRVKSRLPMGSIGLFKCFKAFVAYKTTIGDSIGNKWTDISVNKFNSFRCSPVVLAPAPALRPPQPPQDPVHEFKKGIKKRY